MGFVLKHLETNGYSVSNGIYSNHEISKMVECIEEYLEKEHTNTSSNSLFSIRQLFIQIPRLKELVINDNFKALVRSVANQHCFITKAIFFSKPSDYNWFVSYHQDLSVNLNRQVTSKNYSKWIKRNGWYSAIPPEEVLKRTTTFRIHLDECNEASGALKVLVGTHKKGVQRIKSLDRSKIEETVCSVKQGDLMIMKPLLFHASDKTTVPNKRRIIHIELCSKHLPDNLEWVEKTDL